MLESLRNERIIVGIKQTRKALINDEVRTIYAACDTDPGVLNEIYDLCNTKGIEIIEIESMKQLGKAAGIDVKSAVVAVLK